MILLLSIETRQKHNTKVLNTVCICLISRIRKKFKKDFTFLYPEYIYVDGVFEFVINEKYSNNVLGVFFGLQCTGKKTFIRQTASKITHSAILHINGMDVCSYHVEREIEVLLRKNIKHIFIENIINVIDFQRIARRIKREYSHLCSFLATGDSPFAISLAEYTTLLFSIRYFPTYYIYDIGLSKKEYCDKAIYQNICRGLETRTNDEFPFEMEYYLHLYKSSLLSDALQKTLWDEDGIPNKKILKICLSRRLSLRILKKVSILRYPGLQAISKGWS